MAKLSSKLTLKIGHRKEEINMEMSFTGRGQHQRRAYIPQASPGQRPGSLPFDPASYAVHLSSVLIAVLQKRLLLSFSYNVCLHLL